MKEYRAQHFPAGLLAWLGLILGFSFGLFLDQASNLQFDGNLMLALRACNYCIQAAIPVAAEVVKVNRWTLLGAIAGLLLGILLAALPWLRRQLPPSQTKALAIENAHLVTQAEERVTASQERALQLNLLSEAAGVMAVARHVEEVVTLSLDQLRRLIPYDTATFWQRELSDGHWRVLGARSFEAATERVVGRPEGVQTAVFSEIVTTCSVVFAPDVSRDGRFAAKQASSMRSWLGVPVLSNGAVLGILALEKGEDGFYGPAQVPLALSFANRVAGAWDNARRHEDSVQRTQEVEVISRVCQAISRAISLPQLGDILVAEIGGALKADTIILAVYDAACDAFSFPLTFKQGRRSAAGPRAPAGLLGHVLHKRSSLLLQSRVEAQLEQLGLSYQPLTAGDPVPESYLAVPLIIGSQANGVLAVEEPQQAGWFTPSHEFILNTVAAPIAAVVDNLRLQAEREVRRQELAERSTQFALLNRLSTALMGSLETEEILSRALAELLAALPADHAAGFLLDPGSADARVVSLIQLPGGMVSSPPAGEALNGLLAVLRSAASPVAIANVAEDARLTPAQTAWLTPDARAVLLLPLMVDEKLAGLIGLARSQSGRPFSAGEIETGAICASQAGMAVTRARRQGHAMTSQ